MEKLGSVPPHQTIDDSLYKKMRDRVRTSLGSDYVYFTSDGDVRHTDPSITFIGTLIALLIAALTSAVKEFSKSLGKAGWDHLASDLEKHPSTCLPDLSSQLTGMKQADDAIAEVGKRLSMAQGKEFLATVRSAIEKDLISHRFPSRPASRIAAELTAILEERLTNGRQ